MSRSVKRTYKLDELVYGLIENNAELLIFNKYLDSIVLMKIF